MSRFAFRWLSVSLAVAAVLLTMGSSGASRLALVGAALFLGLLNALISPLTLRFVQTGLLLAMVVAVAALNAFFFGVLGGYVPPYLFPSTGSAMAAAAIVSAVSWPANFFFRSGDGHVHAVTHHEPGQS